MSIYQLDRLKILVVDDNPHMRKLIGAILGAFGVKSIYEAGCADDGWKTFCQLNPDIIFVDWMMEPINGLQFTKRVRTGGDSPNPFVPVVMITGHTQVEHVRAARDAGVTEFLAKPVSADAIFSRLQAIIEAPRPFVRTKTYFGPDRRRTRNANYMGPERRNENEAVEI